MQGYRQERRLAAGDRRERGIVQIPMSIIRRIASCEIPYGQVMEFRSYNGEAIEVKEDSLNHCKSRQGKDKETKVDLSEYYEANTYQKLSRRTQSTELSLEDKRRHALFGLCSEVGEIHSIFQHEYQGKPASKEKVIDECGDLLWFLCELCDSFFINLSDVMEYNINKLKKRFPDGFSAERSEKRHEIE